jgi:ribosomal-protein-alanine N-acetyltransferase
MPLTAQQAEDIAGWRHPPPYDTYDVDGDEVGHLLLPDYRYHAVLDGDQMIGYCCFGEDARVAGGRYDDALLDVGWGMRPELMGHGRGCEFVAAIVGFGERSYAPDVMGVTIAEFNRRSQRVAAGAGFTRETNRFTAPDGMRFIQLERGNRTGITGTGGAMGRPEVASS